MYGLHSKVLSIFGQNCILTIIVIYSCIKEKATFNIIVLQADVFLSFAFQNKAFVYRGQEYEKIGSFNQRLKAQFPDGQVKSDLILIHIYTFARTSLTLLSKLRTHAVKTSLTYMYFTYLLFNFTRLDIRRLSMFTKLIFVKCYDN